MHEPFTNANEYNMAIPINRDDLKKTNYIHMKIYCQKNSNQLLFAVHLMKIL